MSDSRKLFIVFFSLIVSVVLFISPDARTQSAAKIKKDEAQIRQEMLEISEQLGVSCTDCHNVENFASDAKPNFKVAKDHMRIVELMHNNGFDGKQGPLVSCYMCHRGVLKPNYKPAAKKK